MSKICLIDLCVYLLVPLFYCCSRGRHCITEVDISIYTNIALWAAKEHTLLIRGCKAFGQLEFWHRALSAYGNLSIGILAYGILTMPLLAYSILAISVSWHIQIIITAWTVNSVNDCFFCTF